MSPCGLNPSFSVLSVPSCPPRRPVLERTASRPLTTAVWRAALVLRASVPLPPPATVLSGRNRESVSILPAPGRGGTLLPYTPPLFGLVHRDGPDVVLRSKVC